MTDHKQPEASMSREECAALTSCGDCRDGNYGNYHFDSLRLLYNYLRYSSY